MTLMFESHLKISVQLLYLQKKESSWTTQANAIRLNCLNKISLWFVLFSAFLCPCTATVTILIICHTAFLALA